MSNVISTADVLMFSPSETILLNIYIWNLHTVISQKKIKSDTLFCFPLGDYFSEFNNKNTCDKPKVGFNQHNSCI